MLNVIKLNARHPLCTLRYGVLRAMTIQTMTPRPGPLLQFRIYMNGVLQYAAHRHTRKILIEPTQKPFIVNRRRTNGRFAHNVFYIRLNSLENIVRVHVVDYAHHNTVVLHIYTS